MKRNIITIGMLGLMLSISISCEKKIDSLDAVRDFKPEDKYFKSSLVSLHFIIETSSIARIDSIFSAMIGAYDLPVDASGCRDGIYEGESPKDAFDYKHWVRLEVKDEKIVGVEYDEIYVDGTGKEKDKAYNDEMKNGGGARPSEAYPSMEQQLKKKQYMLDVDATTGATYSLYRFRYAVTVALMKARMES